MIRTNRRRLPENLKKFAKSVRKCFYLDMRVNRVRSETGFPNGAGDAVGIAGSAPIGNDIQRSTIRSSQLMSKPLPSHMKIKISSRIVVWSAGAVLAFVLIGGLKLIGLYNNSHTPLPTRFSGEVRLMSLTGLSTRPFVIRKKIYTEPQIMPALPATAFSFVITKKIVPPPSGSLVETALSTSQTPVPMSSGMATAETASKNNSAADKLPISSASLVFAGPWQGSALLSRLMNEADASPSVASVSVPTTDAASPSADPSREAAFVSAVLDRVAVSPEIVHASTWTADTGSPSVGPPKEREAPTSLPASESAAIAKQTPSLPYSLQLSSCRSLKNAQNAAADFRKMGLDPFIVNVYLKNHGGSWWRVLFGQYSSMEDALQAKKDLKLSDAIVKRTRFANLIRDYETQELTIEMKSRLETLGFSAYTVEYGDRDHRLFVGAFTRKSQAEEQALELQTKGIMCRVVDR
jgi:cell division septation protein DedD